MNNANHTITRTISRRTRWLIVGGLALLTAGTLVQLGRAVDDAPGPGFAAPSNVMAVTGQITRDSYGIYLVDLNNQTLCVYQYVSPQKKLRLLAARTFAFDSQLDDYNTEPSPREIRALVRQHPRLTVVEPPAVEPTTQPGGESPDDVSPVDLNP